MGLAWSVRQNLSFIAWMFFLDRLLLPIVASATPITIGHCKSGVGPCANGVAALDS